MSRTRTKILFSTWMSRTWVSRTRLKILFNAWVNRTGHPGCRNPMLVHHAKWICTWYKSIWYPFDVPICAHLSQIAITCYPIFSNAICIIKDQASHFISNQYHKPKTWEVKTTYNLGGAVINFFDFLSGQEIEPWNPTRWSDLLVQPCGNYYDFMLS